MVIQHFQPVWFRLVRVRVWGRSTSFQEFVLRPSERDLNDPYWLIQNAKLIQYQAEWFLWMNRVLMVCQIIKKG